MQSIWSPLRTYGLAAAPTFVAIIAPVLLILSMLGHIQPIVVLALTLLMQCLFLALSALRPHEDIDRHDRASYAIGISCMGSSFVCLSLLGDVHLDWLQPVAVVTGMICAACAFIILRRSIRNTKAPDPKGSAS